jgi:hypothetical protein
MLLYTLSRALQRGWDGEAILVWYAAPLAGQASPGVIKKAGGFHLPPLIDQAVERCAANLVIAFELSSGGRYQDGKAHP